MGVQYHFLSFTRISHHEHLAAVTQTKVSNFSDLFHAAKHGRFVTPVKLARFAGWKG